MSSSGLLLPARAEEPEGEHPATRYVNTFVTHEELYGERLNEERIVELLGPLSAYDCLAIIGRISCMVHTTVRLDTERQLQILERFGWQEGLREVVGAELTRNGPRVIFFPQQLIHLARLVVRHADLRPADNFDDGKRIEDFATCVLGVSDLLEEGDLDDPSRLESVVPWITRQWAINGRDDSVLLWTRYYDVLVRTWNDVATPEAFNAAEAFERYTGITLQDWLSVGFAVFVRFFNYGGGSTDDYFLDPEQWFSKSAVREEVWQTFLERNSQTLEECRDNLLKEDEIYGPTMYRSQTFESKPLLSFPDGRLIPLALDAVQRRATEGMFFELADGAISEGHRREHFTSPFGRVFEEFVQRSFERMFPSFGAKRVHRPIPYERDGDKVDSSDAVLDLAPDVAFVEVVARRPRVATLTRGDYATFVEDLEKGVLKKAHQLHLNIFDFCGGTLRFEGLTGDTVNVTWPILVMVEGFPTMPPIPGLIESKLAERGELRDGPPLAIMSAEDLALLEALLLVGFSALDLFRAWRAEGMRDLPFQNFLDALDDDRIAEARRAPFFTETWNELTEMIVERVLPGQEPPKLA
ncbi:MAG: hypothetical protein QOF13_1825 [Solirubrobacterales bacterium]|jgi:hypothetical protein|nr:hypothetical protein [Solirubrobacterales bacterium]